MGFKMKGGRECYETNKSQLVVNIHETEEDTLLKMKEI